MSTKSIRSEAKVLHGTIKSLSEVVFTKSMRSGSFFCETSDFYIISKGFKASSKVWIRHGQFMLSLVSRTSTSVPMSPAPSPFAKKECSKLILNTIIQCWVIVQLERQRPRHVVHPVERRKLKHHRRWKGPFYPNLKTTTHRLYQVR